MMIIPYLCWQYKILVRLTEFHRQNILRFFSIKKYIVEKFTEIYWQFYDVNFAFLDFKIFYLSYNQIKSTSKILLLITDPYRCNILFFKQPGFPHKEKLLAKEIIHFIIQTIPFRSVLLIWCSFLTW